MTVLSVLVTSFVVSASLWRRAAVLGVAGTVARLLVSRVSPCVPVSHLWFVHFSFAVLFLGVFSPQLVDDVMFDVVVTLNEPTFAETELKVLQWEYVG